MINVAAFPICQSKLSLPSNFSHFITKKTLPNYLWIKKKTKSVKIELGDVLMSIRNGISRLKNVEKLLFGNFIDPWHFVDCPDMLNVQGKKLLTKYES